MILRSLIRVVYGVHVFEAVAAASRDRDILRTELSVCRASEREARAASNRFWRERDAARDQVLTLTADLDAMRKTNALLRSLVSNRFWRERDAARDQVLALTADLDAMRKTNALLRSLVSILRDANQNLDERLIDLEKRHFMPAPAADADCASEPDRR